MAPHGTRTRYRSGCDAGPGGRPCAPCREAEAAAKRRSRARRPDAPRASHAAKPNATATATNVVSLPTTHRPDAPTQEMGPNEIATRAEIEIAPRAKDRPSLAAQAITLARTLDRPDMAAASAQLSRQLQAVLRELQPGKKKSGGRLATVSAMAGRRVAQ